MMEPRQQLHLSGYGWSMKTTEQQATTLVEKKIIFNLFTENTISQASYMRKLNILKKKVARWEIALTNGYTVLFLK